ncbi:hypothetical protein [Anaerosinus sp.]|uniref:hypothetical protein n=1 Tax=Selenobaculum sp. TaxID=3074374 RepID=UPI003AB57359
MIEKFNNGIRSMQEDMIKNNNPIYIVDIAEILRAQTEAMMMAYQMGLQERMMIQGENNIIDNVIQTIETKYYVIFNNVSCGIFTDLQKLGQSKKYGNEWTEKVFLNINEAQDYLRRKMSEINEAYDGMLPMNFDVNWMYHAIKNFQSCTRY